MVWMLGLLVGWFGWSVVWWLKAVERSGAQLRLRLRRWVGLLGIGCSLGFGAIRLSFALVRIAPVIASFAPGLRSRNSLRRSRIVHRVLHTRLSTAGCCSVELLCFV